MLQELLGRVGRNCYIEPPFYVDYGCNISIGDNFYANSKYVSVSLLFCVYNMPHNIFTNVL